jgi:Homeodomain-like domain
LRLCLLKSSLLLRSLMLRPRIATLPAMMSVVLRQIRTGHAELIHDAMNPQNCPRVGDASYRHPRHRVACRGHHELVLENLALRQQLIALNRSGRRPRVRSRDRLFWIALAATWRRWRTALVFVQPDSVVRWHREWLRRRWTKRSRHRGIGRPPAIDAKTQALVLEMAAANPLWGAPRIHGELRVLGIDISERTVSRQLARGDGRPSSQTWRTFLANHLPAVTSMDFFTVPTLTGRVLFVSVLLSHERRRLIHFNVTEHPRPSGPRSRSSRRFQTKRPRGGS